MTSSVDQDPTTIGYEVGVHVSNALADGLPAVSAVRAAFAEAGQSGLQVPAMSEVEVGSAFYDGMVAGLTLPLGETMEATR